MTAQKENRDKERLAVFRRTLYAEAEQNADQAFTARKQLLDAFDQAVLTERLKKRRLLVSMVAAAAGLLMMGVGLFLLVPPSSSTKTRQLTGLLTLDSDSSLLNKHYSVPPTAGAKMVWPDSTTLWLKGSTCLGFNDHTLSRLAITTGALLASVTPREHREFAIQTPLGTVRVHGTIFSIWVRNEVVTVRLHEGNVTFEGPEKMMVLNSGESLHVEKGKKGIVSLIDENGLLQDLMIAERTAELPGPPVPLLGRNIEMTPLDVVANQPRSAYPPLKRSTQKRPAQRLRTSVKSSSSYTLDAGAALFVDPELQAIDVTHQPTLPRHLLIEALIRKRDYKNCVIEAEKALATLCPDINRERVLYLKGYCEMRAGNLKAGREAFEHYLIQFPSGRHQKRIQEILGE